MYTYIYIYLYIYMYIHKHTHLGRAETRWRLSNLRADRKAAGASLSKKYRGGGHAVGY